MSGEAARSPNPDPTPRHDLLPFVANWKRMRTMALYGAGVLIIGSGVDFFDHRASGFEFLVLGLLLLAVGLYFQFGANRHYVRVEADGLLIHGLRSGQLVPFQSIRQARTQPLRVIFSAPSRKALMLRSLRQFEQAPAVVVRLDLEPAEVARLGRSTGRGTVVDQDLILLVADAAGLDRSLQPRLRRRPPAPAGRRR